MSGGDCLLFAHPDEEFIMKMSELIDKGILKLDILVNRAYRVISFVNDCYNISTDIKFDIEEHQKIAREVVEKSVKVYRDRKNILPLSKKYLKIAHIVIAKQIKQILSGNLPMNLPNMRKLLSLLIQVVAL